MTRIIRFPALSFFKRSFHSLRRVFRVRPVAVVGVFVVVAFTAMVVWAASAPTTINDFFLPGSQPGQSGQLQTPDKCDNCHGGYDTAVEPAFNWRGSMMAQAARDPLFYACLAVANQDAPESGDLCIRCHSPAGWLEGRSSPTDGSALNNNDREGVQCDFCHKLVKPTLLGGNPYPSDADYTGGTYSEDQSYLSILNPIPGWSANGMYIADSNNAKRGPFVDAVARHQMFYSPFHSDAALCGTCHDVSNPVFSRDSNGNYVPNTFDQPAPDFNPHSMFPVERTYSEWTMSAFATTPGGVETDGRFGGNKSKVSTCQDCHMQDVTGVGCNKRGAPTRDDLPLHDLTGGNTFVPQTLAALWPGEVDPAALDAGVTRARSMLQRAAELDVSSTSASTLKVTVTNETGHKLPSGYPEGRRIWLNVKFFDANGDLISESGGYNPDTAAFTTPPAKIYEAKLGMTSNTDSFHFVLNNHVVKDNRIPPRGFTNANFATIQSPPVGYTYEDGHCWDETSYTMPDGTAYAEVRLYYQAVSPEYIAFLKTENHTNDAGNTLYQAWLSAGKSAPELMAMATWGTKPADTQAPSAPTSLTASAASRSEIDLSWSASTDNIGVTGYYILRDGVNVATATTTSYRDVRLKRNTTYCYAASAFDQAGNISPSSNQACATTSKH